MTVIYILLALLGLGILVFIHELGHYIVAKRCGMTVEVFSIGFGKPILKWTWQNVQWQLGLVPFGGFVKIAGMEVGKKEKNLELHEIPGGFFQKSPSKRIAVALAGPLANFVLAVVLFTILWTSGGREKPFSEFTHIIGWVDPASPLYERGLRPGDELTYYNKRPYTGTRDLLLTAVQGNKKVVLQGNHIDYYTGRRLPFSDEVETYPAPEAISDVYTTGVTQAARYLIYTGDVALPAGSPMEGSGLTPHDRLVWMDGELLFSLEQLSAILNDDRALLTVRRGDELFLSRQKRVAAGDLSLPTLVKNELSDWQYEAGLKGKWQQLKVLPYYLAVDATVEGELQLFDGGKEASRSGLEMPLAAGDRIVAVDGEPIETAYQLLDLLQTRHVQIIVEKQMPLSSNVSSAEEDETFIHSFDTKALTNIASTLGTKQVLTSQGRYALLRPVQPKRMDQFALSSETKEQLKSGIEEQKSSIEKIRSETKRSQLLAALEQKQNRYLLGINLDDRTVVYNPAPFALFASVFSETKQTLQALFTGSMNPKWLAGPVGIVHVIEQGWRLGIGEALFWMGVISINLAVFNLLPIPLLDGGHICISLWELITKRRIKAKTLERIIIPFVVLIVALFLFLTFQDITRLFT